MSSRRFCRPPSLGQPGFAPPARPRETAPPTAEISARRILALHLPRLVTEGLGPGPVLAWAPRGPRQVVVALDPLAEALGLRLGQTLADAQAMAPEVRAEMQPATTPRRLAFLALWALRFTPLAAVEAPDGLLLDISGVAHLSGSEAALLTRVIEGLARLGHAAQGAIAGHAAAAAALARAGRPGTILAPGQELAALGPLPLSALRLPEEVVAALGRLGLRCIREVLAQPRAPLARRFGARLTMVLDAAAGLTTPPIRPIRPPPEFLAGQDFLEPVTTREVIDAVMARLLAKLCQRLDQAGRGLRELLLRAHRADGGVQEIVLGTGSATRDAAHLARLFRDRLEKLEPGFGFDRMALLATRTEALAASQNGLAPGAAERREALARLLDRLSQRLPVWRLAPRASHWPERAMRRADPFEAIGPMPPPRPRPVRLLRQPSRLEAVALLPDAPPSMIRLHGVLHRIRRAEGPERLSPEWWRDDPNRRMRDYYRVECEDGTRLWLCRAGLPGEEGTAWLQHGWLA